MMHIYRLFVLLLALVLLWGCGAPPAPPSGDEALQRVVQMLEATAEQSAGNLPREGREMDDSPLECRPWWATNEGRIWGYMLTIDLRADTDPGELVEATYNHWQDEGYEVKARNLNTDPALHTTVDGYNFELTFSEDEQHAYLSGSTPCIPNISESAAQ